jgi:hypothetical protein
MGIDPKDPLAKHKEIMGRVDFKRGIDTFDPRQQGPTLQQELVKEVKKLLVQFPRSGLAEPSSVKSYERALEKVSGKLKGDWQQLNDLARCTLVVRWESQVPMAVRALINHFRTVYHTTSVRNTLQFVESKSYKPHKNPPTAKDLKDNPCNYSGDAVIVRTRDFRRAEIQINYWEMQYAKSLPEFLGALGTGAETEMRGRFAPVPGGLGHKMYEAWRANPESDKGKANAAACKLYFDYFRAAVRTPEDTRKVLRALWRVEKPGFRSTG